MSPKAARFVAEYLSCHNATQAAIRAGYSERSAASIGEENLRKPEIAAAVKAAQDKLAASHGITLESHLTDLKRIRDAAFDEGKFSAAASAEMARGKVSGFYVDRIEVEDVTDKAAQMRDRREKRLARPVG